MAMNTKQQMVLLGGIVFALAIGLFPPWKVVYVGFGAPTSIERPLGHYLIIRPPTTGNVTEKYSEFTYHDERVGIRLDVGRLLVSWVLVVLLTGGLIVILQDGTVIWAKKKVRRKEAHVMKTHMSYKEMETDELLRIISIDSEHYRPEAIESAEAELASRGVSTASRAPAQATLLTSQMVRRDLQRVNRLVTIVAWIYIGLGGLLSLVLLLGIIDLLIGSKENDSWVMIGLLVFVSVLFMGSGIGLLRRRTWARGLTLVLGYMQLVSSGVGPITGAIGWAFGGGAVGILLGAFTVYVLQNSKAAKLFSQSKVASENEAQDKTAEPIKQPNNQGKVAHVTTIHGTSYLDELKRLAELRDKGVITEEEFSAKKRQLLKL
jgi:hypothetical protein